MLTSRNRNPYSEAEPLSPANHTSYETHRNTTAVTRIDISELPDELIFHIFKCYIALNASSSYTPEEHLKTLQEFTRLRLVSRKWREIIDESTQSPDLDFHLYALMTAQMIPTLPLLESEGTMLNSSLLLNEMIKDKNVSLIIHRLLLNSLHPDIDDLYKKYLGTHSRKDHHSSFEHFNAFFRDHPRYNKLSRFTRNVLYPLIGLSLFAGGSSGLIINLYGPPNSMVVLYILMVTALLGVLPLHLYHDRIIEKIIHQRYSRIETFIHEQPQKLRLEEFSQNKQSHASLAANLIEEENSLRTKRQLEWEQLNHSSSAIQIGVSTSEILNAFAHRSRVSRQYQITMMEELSEERESSSQNHLINSEEIVPLVPIESEERQAGELENRRHWRSCALL